MLDVGGTPAAAGRSLGRGWQGPGRFDRACPESERRVAHAPQVCGMVQLWPLVSGRTGSNGLGQPPAAAIFAVERERRAGDKTGTNDLDDDTKRALQAAAGSVKLTL